MRSIALRLSKIFEGANVERIAIINTNIIDSNFLYVSGFTSGIFEDSALILNRKSATLITSQLEYGTALLQKPAEMQVVMAKSRKDFGAALRKHLNKRTVGINGGFLPYSYVKLIRKSKPKSIIDVSSALGSARLVKDSNEIALMRKANAIAKKAFAQIPAFFREGVTEKQLAAHFDYLMMRNGADGPSFPTIVSFGRNAALPHHMPDDTALKGNSILLIDAGAKYNNYCSDLTRTFIFKPQKDSRKYAKIMDMYRTVKKAQELALHEIKPGAKAYMPHVAAENYINAASNGIYKGRFIHSVGHSIGIDVHDGFGLSSGYKFKLKPGMVFSDEPGIYIEGFGGVRIEDDVLVTEKGAEFF
ncbi:MAG: aminopeptidase P family protein [Candidatus Micrarchaeaceae archaeon]